MEFGSDDFINQYNVILQMLEELKDGTRTY